MVKRYITVQLLCGKGNIVYLVLSLAVSLSLLGGCCYGTKEEAAPTGLATLPTDEPPVVLTTQPADSNVPIPRWTSIQILFSKPMDREATGQALIISPETDYEILWEEDDQLMIIYPLKLWEGTRHEITITGEARAKDGLFMGEDYTFSFLGDPTHPC